MARPIQISVRKQRALLVGALGCALAAALFLKHDLGTIGQSVVAIGWGMAAVVAWRFASLGALAEAWRQLLPAGNRPGFLALFPARWIGESVNSLLPVAQIGGEVVRARLAGVTGSAMPAPEMAAIVVADMTVAMATQMAFTAFAMERLLGIGVLSWWSALGALLLSGIPLALFAGAQAFGAFGGLGGLVSRLGFDRGGVGLASMTQEFDRRLRSTYRQAGALARAVFWQSAGWLLRGAEVWVTLHLLGSDIGFAEAVALESAVSAARTLGFAVPGGLGIQEGMTLLVGGWFGLTPETALAFAVIKRARELMVGLPGLFTWMLLERNVLKA